MLLEATGRSFSTLIAFGGIGGLALAFASQEIISNFFGGFMIYITQPFAIDDWILLPDLSVEGVVEQIGWYTTHIRSLDKQPMYIPNSLFNKQVVITRSRMSHRQIKEVVGVRSEDYNKLRAITEDIEKQLRKHHDIDHSQSIIVRFSGYGPSTLDIYISAYTNKVDTSSYMRVKEAILFAIGDTIARHGAEIPNTLPTFGVMPPAKPAH
jgi:MscS family membrane protein